MSLTTDGRPSLRMLAERSGLSIKTISDIINRDKRDLYRESTVQKVLDLAREMNYRPNRAAQLMRSSKNSMIGFLTWNFNRRTGHLLNYGIYPFIIGLSHRLIEEDYHLGLSELEEMGNQESPDLPKILQEHFYDGFVVQHAHINPETQWLERCGVPIVWWDSGHFQPENCIQRNEVEVGRLATQNAIRMGHRRVGFLWIRRHWDIYAKIGKDALRPQSRGDAPRAVVLGIHYSFIDRYTGYLHAMREAELEPEVVVEGSNEDLAGQIRSKGLTALVNTSGSTLAWLQRSGGEAILRIPDDLSLVSCDVEARLPGQFISVTGGMTYDRYDAGKMAAEMLLSILGGGQKSVPSVELLGSFQAGNSIRNL